jgi:Flp pilus assembly protein TadB
MPELASARGGMSVFYSCVLAFVIIRWYTNTFGQAFLVFLVGAAVACVWMAATARREQQQEPRTPSKPDIKRGEMNGTLVNEE